jgi:predicted phosphodiesterase
MSVYAVSDLHGELDLLLKIKEFLNPEDTVYCLGDCGDRGPWPWEVIKMVYEDPQFIYLKGNHEDMLIDSMKEFITCGASFSEFYLLASNGGSETFQEWKHEKNKEEWIKKLENLPVIEKYINKDNQEIILTHSGFTPREGMIHRDEDYIWNRHHFYNEWDFINFPNTIIVHGHTPLPYLYEYIDPRKEEIPFKAAWYCSNHKVDIDLGSFFTGATVLLNLDTFEEILFRTDECESYGFTEY